MKLAAVLAALVVAGAASWVMASPREARAGPRSALRCVRLAETRGADDRSLVFTLRNGCDRSLECTVTWDLTCDGEASAESRSSTVEAHRSAAFLASAASCQGRSWRISPPRWRCS